MLFGVPLVYLVCAADSVTRGYSVGDALYWTWRNMNGCLVVGAILGGLVGLAMGGWQARLRWLLGSLLVAPLSVLAIWLYLRFQWGADITSIVVKDGCFDLRDFATIVTGLAITLAVLAWATHRFVLRRPQPRFQ